MNTFPYGQVGRVVIFPATLDEVCFAKRCVVTEAAISDMLNEQGVPMPRGTFHVGYFDYNVTTGTERYMLSVERVQAGSLKMVGYIDTEEDNKDENSDG